MTYGDFRRPVCGVLGVAALALLTACASTPPSRPDLAAETVQAPASRSPFVEPPGVFYAAVTQSNVASTICVSGWTATVRPPTSYTQGVKRSMLVQTGANPSEAIKFELDHFIPLALGGDPRSLDNLWLQRWDGEWNAKIKDRLERKLQLMVCAGKVALQEARTAIQQSWKDAYRKYVESGSVSREMDIDEAEAVE